MGTIILALAVLILLALSALLAGLTLGLLSLSHHELKRKAQLGIADAIKVYPIRVRGHELLITLMLSNVLVNSTITVLLNSFLYGVVAVILSALLITVFAEILPQAYLKKHGLQFGARLSPFITKLMLVFHPIAGPLARILDRIVGEERPPIYSRAELLKILEEHRMSPYSDIEEDEVKIIEHALSYGDKLIRDIMTPRQVVKLVAAKEVIGPALMNELHASGYSRFPVYQDTADHIVGTLYLRDLVSARNTGTVGDVMSQAVFYVHDEQLLDHALQAFLKTKHHLFIVVNSFEEFVGIVTVEDVLEQIIGKKIMDEFDQFDDMRAVAALKAKEIRRQRVGKVIE